MMSAKGEALCHTCLKVLCDIAASSDTRAIFTHELPYNKLLQAVQNGCPLCTRLQAAGILSKYDAVVSVKLFKNVDIPQNGSLLIFVSARKDVKDRLFRLRQIDPLREYSAHSNLLLEQASYKSGSTGSAPCTSLVRQWINLCSGNHACSYRSVAPNPTPTRLIFVGETSDDIRLCETEKMPKALEYTTVSHRWGIISDRCVLESSTLGEWLRKIPERAITKVFQDAIRLTRSLGLSYIWIDCCCKILIELTLCEANDASSRLTIILGIIQDSEDDWQREASRMSEIYRNSYCTISASGAEHAGDGCFFDRDLALNASFHFAAPTAVDLHGASDEVSLYEVSEHRIWLNGVEKTRLNSRGWVFQEASFQFRDVFQSRTS